MSGREPLFEPWHEVSPELEARNGVLQLDYITELIESGARDLRESHVLGLQALAVQDVYPCAGHYRDATKDVFIQNSKHQVPSSALVPSFVRDAIDWVNRETDRPALERAAYAQWRFNWIHPFPPRASGPPAERRHERAVRSAVARELGHGSASTAERDVVRSVGGVGYAIGRSVVGARHRDRGRARCDGLGDRDVRPRSRRGVDRAGER